MSVETHFSPSKTRCVICRNVLAPAAGVDVDVDDDDGDEEREEEEDCYVWMGFDSRDVRFLTQGNEPGEWTPFTNVVCNFDGVSISAPFHGGFAHKDCHAMYKDRTEQFQKTRICYSDAVGDEREDALTADAELKHNEPFPRASDSPYLRLLQDTYRGNFEKIVVLHNVPWISPRPEVIERYRLEQYGSPVEGCIPRSFYMELGFPPDEQPLEYAPHGTWDLASFLTQLTVLTVHAKIEKERLLDAVTQIVRNAVLDPGSTLTDGFWVFEEAHGLHVDFSKRDSARTFRIVLLQTPPRDAHIPRPKDLAEMSGDWVARCQATMAFAADQEAVRKALNAVGAGVVVERPVRSSECVFDTISRTLRVYINCNPARICYGYSAPSMTLYRYQSKDPVHLPIPTIVRTDQWDKVDPSSWNTLIHEWHLKPDPSVDLIVTHSLADK